MGGGQTPSHREARSAGECLPPHAGGYLFFTKNGVNLGVAAIGVDCRRDWYAAVGLDAPFTITYNFGAAQARPWMFDLPAFEAQLRAALALPALPVLAAVPHAQRVASATLQPRTTAYGARVADVTAIGVTLAPPPPLPHVAHRGGVLPAAVDTRAPLPHTDCQASSHAWDMLKPHALSTPHGGRAMAAGGACVDTLWCEAALHNSVVVRNLFAAYRHAYATSTHAGMLDASRATDGSPLQRGVSAPAGGGVEDDGLVYPSLDTGVFSEHDNLPPHAFMLE
ncbi:hypothetical protein EON62_03305, partial [archaeon]